MFIRNGATKTHISREVARERAEHRERLIAARMSAKLPRRQFAEKIGVKYLSLKAWELGRFRTPLVAVVAAEFWCELNRLRTTIENKLNRPAAEGTERKR